MRQRNHRDRLLLDWNDALMETVADPRATSETGLAVRQIIDAVARLPEPQRIALLLVSIDGFSYQEAADTLDIPVGTIMSRISRARKAIRTAFDEPGESRMPAESFVDTETCG
ncbi:RNA polymerase sigma factor [Burkholderia stabilis]|nr:RNA polymerase sigma factor [Burkholderia stabilis]